MDVLLRDELALSEVKEVYSYGNNAIQGKKQELAVFITVLHIIGYCTTLATENQKGIGRVKRQYLITERTHFMCPNMHFGILLDSQIFRIYFQQI